MQPGDSLIYHGPTDGDVCHGEFCEVLELLPHGYTEPNGNVYIGEWVRVESLNEPGLVFAMPQRYFHPPETKAEKRSISRFMPTP